MGVMMQTSLASCQKSGLNVVCISHWSKFKHARRWLSIDVMILTLTEVALNQLVQRPIAINLLHGRDKGGVYLSSGIVFAQFSKL